MEENGTNNNENPGVMLSWPSGSMMVAASAIIDHAIREKARRTTRSWLKQFFVICLTAAFVIEFSDVATVHWMLYVYFFLGVIVHR